FTGRTMEQEVGKGWIENFHPDDLKQCQSTYMAAFHKRENFRMEYRMKRFDGQWRWMLETASPLYSAEGEFTGYIGSCIDINERKEMEASLRQSEERFSSFMNHLAGAAWMKDLKGRYIYVNKTT